MSSRGQSHGPLRRATAAVLAASLVLLASATPSHAQEAVDTVPPSVPPGCAAAACEDGSALITALDALIRMTGECAATAPALLNTLHWAPSTVFTSYAHSRRTRVGLPSSPVAMRLADLIPPLALQRYWSRVRVVDEKEVIRSKGLGGTCLFVFSPPSWRGQELVRISVGIVRSSPWYASERFVYLRRDGARWLVVRIESGMES